ncbi:MAG: mannitol dehydrogenase family protein [Ktedonobacterales bacterium]|nr:mannitol dehydrogenase family protein [Ktedonobacterales bacterium]
MSKRQNTPSEAVIQPLMTATLPDCLERIAVPTYDRTALRPGIVHLGVGNFHRAHQLAYLDALAARGLADDWGECGVSLHSAKLAEALAPQDLLYTLVERGADHDTGRIIGALTHYLYAPDDPQAVVQALAAPTTRIVTLTITKDGYDIDLVTGEFLPESDDVQIELADPDQHATVFGYLCDALAERRRAGRPPFTVLSCDNLQDSGGATRTALVAYARLRDAALADWIDAQVAFPSSMVDRITPQTTEEARALVATTFGIRDHWPVITEPFSQWIIEDTFCAGRPPLEEVGVQFVQDVMPYGKMKGRLLNASHSAIAYLGALLGYQSTSEVMRDPTMRAYSQHLLAEVRPLLPAVPGIDLTDYCQTLSERFANPHIGDPLTRLAARGSSKVPTFILPSITDALTQGRPHALLDLAIASWYHYLRGQDETGANIKVVDPLREELQNLVQQGGDDPRPFLRQANIFDSLSQNDDWMASVQAGIRSMTQRGVTATVAAYLADAAA